MRKTKATKVKKKPIRLAKALLETAAGMRKSGLLDRAAYDKIARRHRGRRELYEEAGE